MKKTLSIMLAAIFIIFLEMTVLINDNDAKKDRVEKSKIEVIAENNIEEDKTIYKEIVDTSKADYTYSEMVDDLCLLNKKYKNQMKLNVLGKSYDNRNIYEVILGNQQTDKHFLILGSIHGSEYLNSLLLMKQLEYYLEAYEKKRYNGVRFKDLFEKAAFHIVPMTNPDGVTICQKGINGIVDLHLKKYIYKCYKDDLRDGITDDHYEKYLKKWKANARGVDLNRNFNAAWESINQVNHPSYRNYKGEFYESELETKILVQLTKKYNFLGTISYHSSGELIYWDYEHSLRKNECSLMADIAAKVTGYKKGLTDNSYNNVVSGGYKDWASSKENHPIPSITVETGKGGCPLEISEFNQIWFENYNLWAAYAYEFK